MGGDLFNASIFQLYPVDGKSEISRQTKTKLKEEAEEENRSHLIASIFHSWRAHVPNKCIGFGILIFEF